MQTDGKTAFKWMLIGMLFLLLVPINLAFNSWCIRSADAVDAHGAGVLVGRFMADNCLGILLVFGILCLVWLLSRWKPGARPSD